MRLNVTAAEAAAVLAEEAACQLAPGRYDVYRWTKFVRERFGIKGQWPPEPLELVIRSDRAARDAAGVPRGERR